MSAINLDTLRLLQADNRRSAADLGEKMTLSVLAAGDRVRRLSACGLVRANRTVVDPRLSLCAFMVADSVPRADAHVIAQALMRLLGVQEAHRVTGPHSWLLKARVHDAAALQDLLANHFKPLPGVLRTETFIALDTVKEATEMALDESSAAIVSSEAAR